MLYFVFSLGKHKVIKTSPLPETDKNILRNRNRTSDRWITMARYALLQSTALLTELFWAWFDILDDAATILWTQQKAINICFSEEKTFNVWRSKVILRNRNRAGDRWTTLALLAHLQFIALPTDLFWVLSITFHVLINFFLDQKVTKTCFC